MSFNATANGGYNELSYGRTGNFSVITLLMKWRMNHRGRSHLAALPDFMLKDLGISQNQAEQEYQKPFWKS